MAPERCPTPVLSDILQVMDVLAQGGAVSVDRVIAIVGAAATIVCAIVAILQYRYTKSPYGSEGASVPDSNPRPSTEIQSPTYGFLIPLFAGMVMSSTAFLISTFIPISRGTFVSWFIFGLLSLYSFIVLIGLGFSFIGSSTYDELNPYRTSLYFAGLALAMAYLILNLYSAGAF